MRTRRDRSFDEWVQEQQRLKKLPASGGRQTSLASPGNVAAMPIQAPHEFTGASFGAATPSSNSKYRNERPDQPPSTIDDVDLSDNWYSPFQPLAPFGPPYQTRPVEWDYPVGYNLNYIQPRMEAMAMFRGMRDSWGVLSTVVSTRQDQLLRIPWTIQRRDKPRASSVAVEEMRRFFRRPDGKLSYSQWTRKLTDDLLVLDAPTIYFARDRQGRPLHAEVLDGATIFPLIDDSGRRPDSIVEIGQNGIEYLKRQPAFQQIRKGLPSIDLDESEIMYVPMRPRTYMPMFGYPATEQILIEATEAIKKTFYQLNFWSEGSIPDLIVTVPESWGPRQIAMFQAHCDAMLSGNLKLKSKIRFLPSGMKPFDIKNSSGESLWSQRDETLIRLVCYAYSVSPTPFVRQTNRSVAQNAQQSAEEEGLFPFMSYWKDDIIDPIIQEKFGYGDIEFVFQPRPEPDQEKAAKIHDLKIKNGEISRNEARAEDGLEPIAGGDVHTIEIGNAVIPVIAAARGDAMLGMQGGAANEGKENPSNTSTSTTPNSKPARPSDTPLRGLNRPREASTQPPTEIHKTTRSQVDRAARQSGGDIDRVSNLVQHVGNYKKGHIWIQGLNVSIENEKGSWRGEKDESGKKWEVKMPAHYGYIRGTLGADNMQVDVYIGKKPKSTTVWVIDQDKVTPDGKNKGFDEQKIMLGYKKESRAIQDYLKSHFDGRGHERMFAVTELPMDELKSWLKNGDMKEPISSQGVGKIVYDRPIKKFDTISTATNILSYDQGPKVRQAGRKTRKRRLRRGPRWLQLS
jgi:Inorganic Pyrophosphatase